jgi:hypothetical protein
MIFLLIRTKFPQVIFPNFYSLILLEVVLDIGFHMR